MNVVSNVIVFYVVFCAKKYMLSFLIFQICDLIMNSGYVSTQSNVGNVYSYYVAYNVQYCNSDRCGVARFLGRVVTWNSIG